jgi:hypothetical protein
MEFPVFVFRGTGIELVKRQFQSQVVEATRVLAVAPGGAGRR